MADRTTEVRADIEQTRARMAGAIAELERKADLAERVREHPWASLAIAFGAGVALSRSRVDRQAAVATLAATKQAGSRLGGALEQVVTAAIGGVVGALHSRVNDIVSNVVTSSRRDRVVHDVSPTDEIGDAPVRAD